MRRIAFFLFSLVLTFGASGVSAAPPAQDGQPVQITIDAGFDGYVRGSDWVPVFVTISNDGPNISGYLRVKAQGNAQSGGGAVYSTPLDLPTQSRKQVAMYVTIDDYTQALVVELLHGDVKVAEERCPLTRVQVTDVLYGVVSDSATGGVNLDRVNPFVGEAYQANIPLEHIPDQANALHSLDALLITDADTGPLGPGQQQAISDWVLSGGHLIVTGGPAWKRSKAGVADLLPVVLDDDSTRTVTVEDLGALEAYLGRRGGVALASTPTIVTAGVPTGDAEVLLSLPTPDDGDIPLIVRRVHGQGLVDYLAIDPNTEPFASWPNAVELWQTLLGTVDQHPSWWRGFGRAAGTWHDAQQATEIIPLALPAPDLIFGFLAVYVILIGPLNYLVLRRVGRRELAWITMPVLILAFSLMAYLTGFGLRGSSAIVNRLNVVQVFPGNDRAQLDGVVGVWSPFRTSYDIVAPEGFSLRPVPVGSVLGGGRAVDIALDTVYTVRDVPVNIGSVRSFVTYGYIDNVPALDAEATLTLASLKRDGTPSSIVITGHVSNPGNVELQDAVLLARGEAHVMGNLSPGDSKSFSITLPEEDANYNEWSAPPVALGLDFLIARVGGFATSTYRRPGGGTVDDIMQLPDDFYYRRITTERERELRRRYLLLNALIYDMEPTGGRGDNLYLAAWTAESPVDVALEGADYNTVDSTLYLFRIPVEVEARGEIVEIGPEQTSWTLVEGSTRRDLVPVLDARALSWVGQNAAALQPQDQVGFRFTPLPGARLSRVTELILALDESSHAARAPNVDMWNWAEGTWEPVQAGWGDTHIADPERFVGPEGAVKVMVYNRSERTPLTLTRVEVRFRGEL